VHQLKNCFDILVGYRGRTFIMKLKASKKEKLTGEAEFKSTWRGSEYHVVYSVDQAIAIITAPLLPLRNQTVNQSTCHYQIATDIHE
jgi:hypothetical protein